MLALLLCDWCDGCDIALVELIFIKFEFKLKHNAVLKPTVVSVSSKSHPLPCPPSYKNHLQQFSDFNFKYKLSNIT